MLDLALTVAAVAGFAALLVSATRRHARDRQPGALALAHVLGVYVVAGLASLGQLLSDVPGPVDDLSRALLAAAFSIIPLLMLRFADEFVAVPQRLQYLAVGVWVPMAVVMMLSVLDALPTGSEGVVLTLFVLLWAAGHGVAVAWLLRGARRLAAVVARRRAQLMAAAVGGLGAVLPLGVLVREVTDAEQVTTPVLLFAVATICALLLGFAPPSMLRWQWSRRDRELLEHAQRRLVEVDDPDELAAELLPHVMGQCGAAGAWLLAGDEVAASSPEGTPSPWRPSSPATEATEVAEVFVASTADGHVLVAPTMRGHLVLAVDPFALLFGAGELDTVSALAVHLDLVLDRARLKARELDVIREVEEARRIADVERVRDDVLATVSHEMRTPLTTVCGISSLLEQRWGELEAATVGGDLRITVSDRGPGMDREDLERAFEPFYRGGDVLRRQTRGLGLGLAVVTALAASVGAHLEADSEPQRGTRVTVILPDAVEAGVRTVGA